MKETWSTGNKSDQTRIKHVFFIDYGKSMNRQIIRQQNEI